jgi:hypothetical protein
MDTVFAFTAGLAIGLALDSWILPVLVDLHARLVRGRHVG